MKDFFKHDADSKNEKGKFTSAEIAMQPEIWKKTKEKLQNEQKAITGFLNGILNRNNLQIVLTGAGSSAFIGDVVFSTWKKLLGVPVRAIATTDLVTHFEDYILRDSPLLLISFARSGNSPESTAAIQIADRYCNEVFHLVITCNPDGKLAQLQGRDDTYVFLLPPEAEDQSLAMTNSFTSMALAACIIPALFSGAHETINSNVERLCSYGQKLITDHIPLLQEVAGTDFERIVFLGSGSLGGTARESHLKVQELTNGEVIGKYDSFLGFRHGPKAVINNKTLLVYLHSNNRQVLRYEKDLVSQVARHNIDLTTLAVSETIDTPPEVNYRITMSDSEGLPENFWAIFCTLPAQVIGFFKSLELGYDPDSPSPEGTISRVVEGVRIYND